jgi:hypothetical protein
MLPAALVGRKQLLGGVTVHITDRGGPGSLAGRVSFSSDPLAFDTVVMLAPNVGGKRLRTDITKDPYRPHMPPDMNRSGFLIWGLFKVCVDSTGAVTRVSTMKSADVQADAQWMALIRTWRYQPYELDGRAIAFCHPMRLQVGADIDPNVAK